MMISGLTAQNISTTVWAQAVRKLTGLGAVQEFGAEQQSLAIGAVTPLTASFPFFGMTSVFITQPVGGAGNSTIELYDGTQSVVLATAAPGATAFVSNVVNGQQLVLRVRNSNNTNAATYSYDSIMMQT